VILVLDSSALIALARIKRLDLVNALAEHVHIPGAVFDEVAGHLQHRAGSVEVRSAPWLRVDRMPDSRDLELMRERLGRGEAESIVLAGEIGSDFVVLDDAAARRIAEARGLRVIGVLGILVLARERGLIPSLKPVLHELRAEGFYISESLSQILLRRVGES
jgi:predicted nucleic acid-binding protein